MAWNLQTKKKEYKLHKNQTHEVITIYGIQVEYVKITQAGVDNVFGEYKRKVSNSEDIFKVYVMPDNADSFDDMGDLFSSFGMQAQDNLTLYISAKSLETLYDINDFNKCVGDLITVESGKIFEVTGIEDEVLGLNNLFTQSNAKNVFMLKCSVYNYNMSNDDVPDVIKEDDATIYNFGNLEAVFNDEVTKQEEEVVDVVKPVSDNVFGSLG